MKRNTKSLVEGVCESSAACLLVMVQGNILVLTLTHLFVASQTGAIAGVACFAISFFTKLNKPWLTPVLLGICTGTVDYMVHPSSIGGAFTEAIVTGIAAGILSYAIGLIVRLLRAKKHAKLADN